MSGEEKSADKFLSYKDSTGTPVFITIDPDTNIKERVDYLKRHGCSNFELLDADKKLIEKLE